MEAITKIYREPALRVSRSSAARPIRARFDSARVHRLSHDYSYLNGVREVFDDFLEDKPEFAPELATSQAMLVKR